jgi:hypothetical protein
VLLICTTAIIGFVQNPFLNIENKKADLCRCTLNSSDPEEETFDVSDSRILKLKDIKVMIGIYLQE